MEFDSRQTTILATIYGPKQWRGFDGNWNGEKAYPKLSEAKIMYFLLTRMATRCGGKRNLEITKTGWRSDGLA